ncbi:uncharacterized protein LOC129772965 [Toxorhynchites rutilus septentrionalis]|uniref:uncharacterized protein LOC129772965 n=1 Tax=Toxorhynchites rutilus septentrionalis TaxID=329112 RepID=UPI002478BF88|nr:uncharacterized protein LOC129772965 [Toxorhynchites rutilus septentrionalis]
MKPLPEHAICVILLAIISFRSAVSVTTSFATQNPNGTDHPNGVRNNRDKRSIFFPYNSCAGILIAIAIPLGIPDRNIFVSYNFEANYNSPQEPSVFTEGLFNIIRGVALPLTAPVLQIHRALDESPAVVADSTEPPTVDDNLPASTKIRRNLPETVLKRTPSFTRKKVYRGIVEQLERNGFSGKRCLLRAICEAADTQLYENNGVLGDLVHIILSPSASTDEHLPAEFSRAEKLGHDQNCHKYRKHCRESVLDLISFMM